MVGGEKAYQSRVGEVLRPCVAQLAVAAGGEDLWKPLNHRLLLKTRHCTAEVSSDYSHVETMYMYM